ncbi:unnamed protein product [Ilex paraguariensis]|uniref:Uncharacterized protein n=1 Tax=Ilex paraguariensis TaxID=185542 RepID=A0ABC8R1H8_9AQUA
MTEAICRREDYSARDWLMEITVAVSVSADCKSAPLGTNDSNSGQSIKCRRMGTYRDDKSAPDYSKKP